MRSRAWHRAGLVLAATVTGVLVSGPAWAHVSVDPTTATQGEDATLSFRVPNEKDDAITVKVEVNLPIDTPIASVSTRPVAGWTVQTATTKLGKPIKTDEGEVTEAVSKITWTAAPGGGIKPGEFQEFDVAVGPLPTAEKIVFKVLQTYSDGEIARWIDPPSTNGVEPEHPAPVLTLGKGTDSGEAAPDTPARNSSSNNPAAIVLSVIALVIGLVGLVVGTVGLRRARSA